MTTLHSLYNHVRHLLLDAGIPRQPPRPALEINRQLHGERRR